MLNIARDVLVKLADRQHHGHRAHAVRCSSTQSLLANVKSFFQDATYNGKTLIGNITGGSRHVRPGRGRPQRGRRDLRHRHVQRLGAVRLGRLHLDAAQRCDHASPPDHRARGTFINQFNTLGTELNTYGVGDQLRHQPGHLQQRQDRRAEYRPRLAGRRRPRPKESAQLQALQIRQQLGTQALSIANQAPQSLLSLFK